ncbi:hypothetical protein A1O7_00669 [Cladophialophora yegresii CBS 114405]|uniref:Ig-like domain-containing protein n=1 Tax=Cladophialophora yegresii CBS 114405 TaxID=1182544 RepID=W9W8S4_9EURO|nr:uncharacterized protein A1O7_00669 [Cladophialophora yegresii CBS 114405]EXJ64333.1 hypothetical protein A1O7_00669 [Cladophialophora yegresii CBS 114405]
MQVLAILLALAAPMAASRKHEGKDHLHPAQRRQVQGLGALVSPRPATAILITASPAHFTQTPTTAAVTPTISSYVFPTTVIQEPVATVCPDTPASSALFSILPVSSLVSAVALASNATRGSAITTNDTTTRYIPTQVNATALLPNGSTTVFLSAATTAAISSNTGDDETTTPASVAISSNTDDETAPARIILDSNGCQTVYSAKTTAWCSTTIKPPGMIAVSVTDCDQWVTFSSQRLDACGTEAAPTAVPTSVAAADDAGGPPRPVAYYLAHWYDLVQGAIPNHVQVQNCVQGSGSGSMAPASEWDCATSRESWDVVTATTTSTGTSVVSFAGPALMTAGTYTLTTTLSFETTRTTTAVLISSSIARHRLGEGGDIANIGSLSSAPGREQTVTVLVTMPTTRTVALETVTRTTVTVRQTSTSTLLVTETRTRVGVGAQTQTQTQTQSGDGVSGMSGDVVGASASVAS